MKDKSNNFFWPSYADLMTSLFFIMLVLYVLTYVQQKLQQRATEEQLRKIKTIQNAVKEMTRDTTVFKYDAKYKRYLLAREINFKGGKWDLSVPDSSLQGSHFKIKESIKYVKETGNKIQEIVKHLQILKKSDENFKDVSYTFLIVGSASNLGVGRNMPTCYDNLEDWNYILSYQRAKSLFVYWKKNNIVDLDNENYHDIIDFNIVGNGLGGIGRYSKEQEHLNQRFMIQIIPKIGDIELK
jgi:hypothetical protein